jgi:DNA-binding ferritin-like protein
MFMKLLEGQNRLEAEVKKSSIKLENIEEKIDIIAEVQTAHKEQSERCFEKVQEQGNTNTLVTSSLKSAPDDVTEVKKDIKELKEKFDKVEKVTIQNTYDVAYLISAK